MIPAPATPPKGAPESHRESALSDDDAAGLIDELSRLFTTILESGRDTKLFSALLRTIVQIIIDADGKVFDTAADRATETTAKYTHDETRNGDCEHIRDENAVEAPLDGAERGSQRMRPEFRDRLEAVIDSFSDDEAADFLQVGARQVQRLARNGTLWFFTVHHRRRYPMWQFGYNGSILPGLPRLISVLPTGWTPEDTHRFMITRSPRLTHNGHPTSPHTWMRRGGNITAVIALIPITAQTAHTDIPKTTAAVADAD